MQSGFERLIHGFCALTGYHAPQRVLTGEGITYDGVILAVSWKPKANPAMLFVYASLGQLDAEHQAELYPMMLKQNFMMLMTSTRNFSFSKSMDSVVLIEDVSLADATPEALLAVVKSLVRSAQYFNRMHCAGNAVPPIQIARNRAALYPLSIEQVPS
ncbi:hypothetical protein RCH09_002466 [Actimicrobium sp. GrIS 1.19]|uniref:CesT family type III secretion system chaperone n=1 Tax=Actimicrobium sp. GrIS 1.19 TaxID=3071708 RepID=UPI002DFA0C8A|nr:hypothetical protein [Actimicrobium sp. GrIS 1.19]